MQYALKQLLSCRRGRVHVTPTSAGIMTKDEYV